MTGPRTTVIIPTRGKGAMVRQAIKSLVASHDPDDLTIVLVEQGGTAVKDLIEKDLPGVMFGYVPAADDWTFSRMNNEAAALTHTPYILCLNNDTICRPGFLDRMIEAAEKRQDAGLIGAKLVHLDNTLQHIGVVFDHNGVPYHLGYGRADDGAYAPAERSDYYDAVTFACVLVRRETWEACEGLDDAYRFNYEDADFCLRAREKGWRCWVEMSAKIVHLENQSATLRSEDTGIWPNLRVFRDRWLTTGRFKRVLGIPVGKTGKLRDDRLNIAFVPGGIGVGVPWWRAEQPARKLGEKGLANIEVLHAQMADEKLNNAFDLAHVVVFQGHVSEWVRNIAALQERRPFGLAYDYDDHPLCVSPYAQAYRTFGCQEIQLESSDGEKVWLWRDGQNGFDLKRNLDNRELQLEIIRRADLMTTSTIPLHQFFSTMNRNVVVLPNCIDFSIFRDHSRLFQRAPGPVRIGWHGGDNHFHDISEVGPALVRYVNEHDVQLVLFGAWYKGPLKGIDPSKVVEEEWVHVEAFPYKLAALGIDVAVIPLADPSLPLMKFNEYKSELKFLEYSALRIPSLVSANRSAYAVCQDRDNALTFADDREFADKLHALCTDLALRRGLAQRAHEWVREYRDIDREIHRWLDAYTMIARHREASAPPEPVADTPGEADATAGEPVGA